MSPGNGRPHLVARLWVIMITSFVDMVGFLVVLPLLPFYAQRFGASPSIIGYLVGVFAIAQLVTAPFWGRLSDRFGRRPVILGGIAASAGAFALFALADSVTVLLLSRLVQGAAGGTIGVIQAYVIERSREMTGSTAPRSAAKWRTDRASHEEGAKALGWVTAATSAGVMLGPALGSLAVRFGESAPGFIAAGLCGLNFAFAWRWMTEPAQEAEHDPADELTDPSAVAATPRVAIWRSFADVLLHPTGLVASLVWIYALGMMAFMAMNGVLALYLAAVFGVTEETIGWFYVFVGAVSLVMRAAALGPIVDRLGTVRTLRLGLLSLVLGLAVLPLPQSLPSFGLAVMLIPIGTALLFPATTSLVSRRARRRQTGQTLGVQQTFGGIARGVGPAWAGLLFQHLGVASPFWVAASLVALASLLALRVTPDQPGATAPLTEPAAAEAAEPS
ncbi:MAG: MFS transporter [Thermoanaerobaculia bacterium]